jgi:hypothetical protein
MIEALGVGPPAAKAAAVADRLVAAERQRIIEALDRYSDLDRGVVTKGEWDALVAVIEGTDKP